MRRPSFEPAAARPGARGVLERWVPWVAAAVLVAGIAAFAAVRLAGGNSSSAPSAAPATVPLSGQAKRVAFRFVDTAVARRHLAESYRLVTPALRGGLSLREWETGSIPVVPYPVGRAVQRWHVLQSFADSVALEVAFLPKRGAAAQPGVFSVGLRKLGGRWLVDSFQARSGVGAPRG